jgi:hypothetical protein
LLEEEFWKWACVPTGINPARKQALAHKARALSREQVVQAWIGIASGATLLHALVLIRRSPDNFALTT